MSSIESDGIIHGGASLEHSLARISASGRQKRVRLPFVRVSGHPVAGEALGVQSALGKTIVKASDPSQSTGLNLRGQCLSGGGKGARLNSLMVARALSGPCLPSKSENPPIT